MESIIVYRNPVEAAFWNALDNDVSVMAFAFVMSFFLLVGLTYSFLEGAINRFARKVAPAVNVYKRRRVVSYVILGIYLLTSAGIVYLLKF